ncbi:hypothetical protein GO495_14140 [Chitinophaga oryziterrae]|uniref:Pentapeptide repeat-containing protein n=1 Tax=Chitinophaga oryziterrae TaxID=1031224 RepID=A0A6N8J8W9_9BACT|nr:pentapeptide repeat-containing protein [Chitinophaga oryziterrae]MVT41725.1 hypothetical protein [Chitinophaga oryziterrae]
MMQTNNYQPKGDPPYDLTGQDLSGQSLEGLDLRKAIMKNTILKGTVFKGVISMQGADLTGAQMGNGTDFSGLDLTSVVFDNKPKFGDNVKQPVKLIKVTVNFKQLGLLWKCIDLTNAVIKEIPADPGDLIARNSNLTGIDLSKVRLDNVHFYRCILTGAKFIESILHDAIFGDQCDLTLANFSKAVMPGAVFNKAILTRTNLDGAVLTNASFLNARMDGTIFDNTNLTNCIFSEPASFSRERNNLTSFRNATLNFSTLNKEWSYLDLRETVLQGLNATVNLDYLEAVHSNLSGRDFTGYHLDDADFSGATLNDTVFKNAVMNRARLKAVKGEKTIFAGAVLNAASFSNSQELNIATVLKGADFTNARLNNALFINADLGPYISASKVSTPSKFNGAEMMNGDFSNVNLTEALLSGGIAMHNTNFTGALFKKANLSGARMGAFSTLFEMLEGTETYKRLLQHLTLLDPYGIAEIFKQYGYSLSPKGALIKVEIAGMAWSINTEGSSSVSYQVLKWTSSDSKTVLIVSRPVSAATLSDAIMIDANLDQADLRNVTATKLELYGPNVKIIGAKLQGIKLSNSNLTGIDLTQAVLYKAVLNGASLINVKLTGANLTEAILNDCNLQGAVFTGTQLDGVTLSGSAVSVNIAQTKTAGVFLLASSASMSQHKALLDELEKVTEPLIADAITRYCSLLNDSCNMPRLRKEIPAFRDTFSEEAILTVVKRDKQWSITDKTIIYTIEYSPLKNQILLFPATDKKSPIVAVTDTLDACIKTLNDKSMSSLLSLYTDLAGIFSTDAVIEVIDKSKTWRIVETDSQKSSIKEYRVWYGYSARGMSGLYMQPLFPKLKDILDKAGVRLRTQAWISKGTVIDSWNIDNDLLNPDNQDTGYVKIEVIKQSSGNVSFYGTNLRVVQINDKRQPEFFIRSYQSTVLAKSGTTTQDCGADGSNSVFGPDTICPNRMKFSTNRLERRPWEEMLRASRFP